MNERKIFPLGEKRIKRHQKTAIIIDTLICKILVSQSGHPQRKEHLVAMPSQQRRAMLGPGAKRNSPHDWRKTSS